ncbi:hypothetical protein HBB16_18725 [Pseudonocardia sp. MCCB 268]|nr:hypothetical protein [Pseudonocardia cytotoxica]
MTAPPVRRPAPVDFAGAGWRCFRLRPAGRGAARQRRGLCSARRTTPATAPARSSSGCEPAAPPAPSGSPWPPRTSSRSRAAFVEPPRTNRASSASARLLRLRSRMSGSAAARRPWSTRNAGSGS